MKEILTFGDVTKDFKRLGVEIRQTYNGKRFRVCEITEEEFEILCNDLCDGIITATWLEGGWYYCEGSNQRIPTDIVIINNKKIIAWCREHLEKHNEIIPLKKYRDLLSYLSNEMSCSMVKNVCALTKDLAKYNNMKLSELFKQYQ